jgi:hypothetical protein
MAGWLAGWMDEPVMTKSLSCAKIAMGDVAFVLVLDSYPAHIIPHVRDKAARLEIKMIPVSRGSLENISRWTVHVLVPSER